MSFENEIKPHSRAPSPLNPNLYFETDLKIQAALPMKHPLALELVPVYVPLPTRKAKGMFAKRGGGVYVSWGFASGLRARLPTSKPNSKPIGEAPPK